MALQFKKVKRKTYYVARNKPLEIRIYKKKKILMEGIEIGRASCRERVSVKV